MALQSSKIKVGGDVITTIYREHRLSVRCVVRIKCVGRGVIRVTRTAVGDVRVRAERRLGLCGQDARGVIALRDPGDLDGLHAVVRTCGEP